mgnify:CR=1 FL=1
MRVLFSLMFFFSNVVLAQDTLYYNFVTQTVSDYKADYQEKGFWVFRGDSLINRGKGYRLKYKVNRIEDNHYYYKNYGYYTDVVRFPGGTVLVWTSVHDHTLYRNMGHRKYLRVDL